MWGCFERRSESCTAVTDSVESSHSRFHFFGCERLEEDVGVQMSFPMRSQRSRRLKMLSGKEFSVDSDREPNWFPKCLHYWLFVYCADTTNSSCLMTCDSHEELNNSSKGRWTCDISQNTLKFSKKILYMVAPQGGNFFVPLQNHIRHVTYGKSLLFRALCDSWLKSWLY